MKIPVNILYDFIINTLPFIERLSTAIVYRLEDILILIVNDNRRSLKLLTGRAKFCR